MIIPQSLTREEAQRQIAELERHIASLPTNNHPPCINMGMLFKHRDGSVFMVCGDRDLLYCVDKGGDIDVSVGQTYSSTSTFGISGKDRLTYLGHAKDLLALKTDKPADVVVTDARAEMAYQEYRLFKGTTFDSIRHILTLALNGKL